jgi:hypothetical protein
VGKAPCPACGAAVRAGVVRCPRCGAAIELPVEALSDGTDDGDLVEIGGRSFSWWWAVAALGAAGLIGVGAALAGRDAPSALDRTTTTTGPSSTSTTSGASPATTAPTRSSTTLPSRQTVPGAPFLTAPGVSGAALYGVDVAREYLWRLDLDTGDAAVRSLESPAITPAPPPGFLAGDLDLIPRDGGVAVAAGFRSLERSVTYFPDDPDLAPRVLATGSDWPYPHADPTLLWVVTPVDPIERTWPSVARVIDLEGNLVAGPIVLPFGDLLGDDGQGRLLVRLGPGVYTVSADGATEQLSSKPVSAWNGGRIVELECAEAEVRCDAVARDRSSGEEVGRAPVEAADASSILWDAGPGQLSPGGTAMVFYSWGLGDPGAAHLVVERFDGQPTAELGWDIGEDSFVGGVAVGAGVWWLGEETLCTLGPSQRVTCAGLGPGYTLQVLPTDLPRFAYVALASPAALGAPGAWRPPDGGSPVMPANVDEYLLLASVTCNAGNVGVVGVDLEGADLATLAQTAPIVADQASRTMQALLALPRPPGDGTLVDAALAVLQERVAVMQRLAAAAAAGDPQAVAAAQDLRRENGRDRTRVEPHLRYCPVP